MSVKDFPPFPYGEELDSFAVRDWMDKLRNRLCIDYQNVIAAPATGDELYLYDVSANVTGKITLANLMRPTTAAGAVQTAVNLYAGTGAPSNADGQNGDYYFRSDGGAATHIYFKSGGAWAGIV